MATESDLLKQLLPIFFEEAEDGLTVMEAGLLELDRGTRDPELIHAIFRAAHSIKGGSGTFSFTEITTLTHGMETLLDTLRSGAREIDGECVAALLAALDHLRAQVEAAKCGQQSDRATAAGLEARLVALAATKPAAQVAAASPQEAAPSGWHIRFAPHPHMMRTGNDPFLIIRELARLGELSVVANTSAVPPLAELDPEELFLAWSLTLVSDAPRAEVEDVFAWVDGDADLEIIPLGAAEGPEEATSEPATQPQPEVSPEPQPTRAAPAAAALEAPRPLAPARAGVPMTPQPPAARPASPEAARESAAARGKSAEASSIRVGIDKVDLLINMVGELVITQSMLSQLEKSFDLSKLERLRQGIAQLERNTRELQESVLRIRMIPISFAFSRFPRVVRDLGQKLGKQVELVTTGEGTELDKTVMERIVDPLVHLVRNALDHGLEPAEERVAAGKTAAGTITLSAHHQGGSIIIQVADDGRGMDTERILAKAKAKGLVGKDEQLPPERIRDLLFQPGFSTADQVSDLSGRGVGLDVVRRNIKALGGNIELDSEVGRGSRFTIRLPLTLAILDGQLVRVGDQTYIIPLVSIVESLQMRSAQAKVIAGRSEVYRLRDDHIPIIRLHHLLGLMPDKADLEGTLMVVVEGDGRRVGVLVDDLLDQQQVVVKSLDANFQRVEGFSGATILGDGKVALILDIPGLIQSASRSAQGRALVAA